MWLKKNLSTVILLLVALIGAGLIAYPSFANWWNSFHQSRAVASYMETVTNLSTEEYEQMILDAEAYNSVLTESGIKWNLTEEETEAYNKELRISESGIMGYIDIPKVNIKLPIYHGTDDAVLQVAVGHLAGTSLPVGGDGSGSR